MQVNIKDYQAIFTYNSFSFIIDNPFSYINEWTKCPSRLRFYQKYITINKNKVCFEVFNEFNPREVKEKYEIKRNICLKALIKLYNLSKEFNQKTHNINILVLGNSGCGKTTWTISVSQKTPKKNLDLKIVKFQFLDKKYTIYDYHDSGIEPCQNNILSSLSFNAILMFNSNEPFHQSTNILEYKKIFYVNNLRNDKECCYDNVNQVDFTINARNKDDAIKILSFI